jgi:N-acetylneuraminate synthase/N,N'-diacetyllegionaminate synthase
MFMTKFRQSPLIIAEAGVNHNGNPDLAMKLIEAAAEAGADLIKFQTFKAYECASSYSGTAEYQKQVGAANQFELLQKLELRFADFIKLKARAEELGLGFLSTPDGEESLEFLCSIGVEAIKIASGEITNLPFLAKIGAKKLPTLLSTGMSDIGEVEKAISTLEESGCPEIILLHCTTEYPAPTDEINLRAMQTLANSFALPVGLSDHSVGIEAAIAATALGANIIEKHFTLDQSLPGPDHAASLNPVQLKNLVDAVRKTTAMLGSPVKCATESEKKNRLLVRRSICAKNKISAGERLTIDNLCCKRPATGIAPEFMPLLTGRKSKCEIEPDQPINWEDLDGVA